MQEKSASSSTLLYSLSPTPKNRALRAKEKQLLRSSIALFSLPKLNNRALEAIKRQLLSSYNNNISSNKPIALSIALRHLYIILCARYVQSALSSFLLRDYYNLPKGQSRD